MIRLEHLYSPPEIGAPGKRRAVSRRRDLLLAGLFVAAMIAVLVLVLTVLSPGFFRGYDLRAYFLEANGLDRGIDVMQEGFVVGHVQSVEPVFAGDADRGDCPSAPAERAPQLPCFRATLRIRHEWPVPAGSAAQLAPAGLLKGNVIRILPGTQAESLQPQSAIATLPPEPDLPARIASTLEQAQSTIDQTIRPTLVQIQERIQGLLGSIDAAGGDAGDGIDPGQGVNEVFERLKRLSADVERIVDPERIGAILAAVEQLTANLAEVSGTFTDRSGDVREAVQSYTALASDIRRVIADSEPELDASLEDAQLLLQELSAALTPILANVETASRNLAALTGDLRQDPKSLLFRSQEKEPQPWFER
ncbi:MAG: MlaD family protein [Thiohalocapsa sp.]|nr:MlaD family protein [Thiohalocapsa sp.]